MSQSELVLPHLTIPADSITLDPAGWNVLVDGRDTIALRDSDPFPEWDARLEFALQREMTVRDRLAKHLNLGLSNDAFEAIIVCSTASGLRRWIAGRVSIPHDVPATVSLTCRPDGMLLATDLRIVVAVHLAARAPGGAELAPSGPADKLWEASTRIRLEGGGARLPIYDVSFSKVFAGMSWDRAQLHVTLLPDPTLQLESAVAVYINADRPEFVRDYAVRNSFVEGQVWSAVVRRLVMAALLDDWMEPGPTLEPSTVGGTVQRWIGQAFHHEPFEALRSRVRSDYSSIETSLESWIAGLVPPVERTP